MNKQEFYDKAKKEGLKIGGKMVSSTWDKEKAKKIFNIFDLEQWGKTISLGFRLGIIIAILAGLIYGLGYYNAMKNRRIVESDIRKGIQQGIIYHYHMNGDWLEVSHSGYNILDANKKLKKTLTMKDCPELMSNYKPIALHTPNLIGVYGLGFGSGAQIEFGAGTDIVRVWKCNLGAILTTKAVYLEVNVPIKKLGFINLENTAIMGGTGYNYKGERQHIVGLRIRF